MSKCVNCLKEINEKEVFCLTCHEEVLECAKNRIADLEAKLAESEKKASKKNDESWDLYLSLKQFYSRLGVEAYADDEIQDVAVKELNRLLNENQQLKQSQKQLAIELEFVLKNFRNRPTYFDVSRQELCLSDQDKQFIDFIDNQINELKGETK